ncbi:GntR family transcriptional regulator [Streptomyces sp. BA2]|uniref:GntR family transcriptional regulator n=1 Tax=Streptomyces sp. BA2 TaxID=436595 RepID=UPI0013238AAB|nr:GntR family transcriptional regulator [Streptomyces sp. BA2]MWA08800.1 GntR family transcriptional regulator [Streptomyces sp. BA2]
MEEQRGTAIYRLFDSDERLLYVGITASPTSRWASHSLQKSWWRDVARFDLAWLPSLEAARAAERAAIHSESPLHNVQLNAAPPSPIEADARIHRYEQIAAELRAGIVSGMYPTGARIPGIVQTAKHYCVSETTAQRALKLLSDEGLLAVRRGAGLFVADREGCDAITIHARDPEQVAQKLTQVMSREDLRLVALALAAELAVN